MAHYQTKKSYLVALKQRSDTKFDFRELNSFQVGGFDLSNMTCKKLT
jgi:hypothetical protein